MLRFVLAVRVLGFTLLFVALALGYLAYRRRPFAWLRSYLVLVAVMAVFDQSFTFVAFGDLFSIGRIEGAHPFFSVLQAAVSVALLYVIPRVIQRLVGTARRKHARLVVLVPIAVLLGGYATIFLPVPFDVDTAVTIFFYLYLSAWFAYGLVRRRQIEVGSWNPWILAFLAIAAVWFAGSAVEMVLRPVLLSVDPEIELIVLTSALFSVFWAVVVIIPAAGDLGPRTPQQTETLPREFRREFELTERESEVLLEVVAGKSNREIAETLGISPRTVDNHVQNLFRKCGVNRRIGLSTLLQRYTS